MSLDEFLAAAGASERAGAAHIANARTHEAHDSARKQLK
jgi:hypothetical protein